MALDKCDRCGDSFHSRVLVPNPIEYQNDTANFYKMKHRVGYTGKLWLCVPDFEEGFLGVTVTAKTRTDKKYEDFYTYFDRVALKEVAKGECAGCPDGSLDIQDKR